MPVQLPSDDVPEPPRNLARASSQRIFWLTALLSALSILTLRAEIPWTEIEQRLAQENDKLARRAQGHAGEYFVVCTVYYTPIESAFTARRGFNVTPETRPGLQGSQFARDFLDAVKMEGFGRLITPVKGKNYIRYNGEGTFAFTAYPRGRAGRLTPRLSAAVRRDSFAPGTEFVLANDAVGKVLGRNGGKIADTGGALRRWQIDLYWGEDEPMGPGKLLARPRGTEFEYAYSKATLKGPD